MSSILEGRGDVSMQHLDWTKTQLPCWFSLSALARVSPLSTTPHIALGPGYTLRMYIFSTTPQCAYRPEFVPWRAERKGGTSLWCGSQC